MTDTVAQLIAGVIVIGIAAVAAFIAFRVGHRHGMREALLMDDALRLAYQAYQEGEAARQDRRPPRPPPADHRALGAGCGYRGGRTRSPCGLEDEGR